MMAMHDACAACPGAVPPLLIQAPACPRSKVGAHVTVSHACQCEPGNTPTGGKAGVQITASRLHQPGC